MLPNVFAHNTCLSPMSLISVLIWHFSLQPLQLSLQKRTTMGSFNTLMAALSERHPEAGKQRIVDALLELRAKQ